MNKKLNVVIACQILFLAVLVGCAGESWQTSAGKFLTSTALAGDTTMKTAAKLEVNNMISPNDWGSISGYYTNSYVPSMKAAQAAYGLAVQLSDPALFAPASNSLSLSSTTLSLKLTTATATK